MPKPRSHNVASMPHVVFGGAARDRAQRPASRSGRDPLERFGAKIEPQADGCWLWTGHLCTSGYGQAAVDGAPAKLVHRLVYEILVGPIPAGEDLHHVCGVRPCCNPQHLTPMEHAEHMAHHAELRRAS